MDSSNAIAPTAPAQDLKKMLTEEQEKRELINKYIEQNLVSGTDYGSISIKGTTSRPSLFKPGAEKMCSLFHLTPRFMQDNDTWEMLGKKSGLICYICELVNTDGKVVGEGRGSALTPMTVDFDINKQIKIAEKRAQTDAVLRAFSLSERFTQDIEDMPKSEPTAPQSKGNQELDSEIDELNSKLRYLYKLMYEHRKGKDIEPLKKQILLKFKVTYMNQLTGKNLDALIAHFTKIRKEPASK